MGADAGAGNAIEAGIPVGEARLVCVRYFDPAEGYWRTCCREVENPACELPSPALALSLPVTDSVRIENTNLTAGETYVWEVDGSPLAIMAPQLTLHLPPGPHEICLLATNDCGSRRTCRTILLPDPAEDLIFDLGDSICGDPGAIIEVPLRVRNFTDIDAFQFTLRLADGRVGKFLGVDYLLTGGALSHSVTNDSTLALIWVQTNAASTTHPDETILGNVRIELSAAPPGNVGITYTDRPVEALFGRTNGDLGDPVLIDGTYGICPADAVLSGRIRRESGGGVALVEVALLRNGQVQQTMTTDLSGDYEFTGLAPGAEYTVRPEKDINHRNGVNAGDMSSIRRHIFGIEELSSPYQRIAANVINFSAIEALDISQLRQLIFRQIPRFGAVYSWHFVPAGYRFPNPEDPHSPAYPTELTLTVASGANGDQDFVAVKMGDIDESALPGRLTNGGGPAAAAKVATDLKFLAVGDEPRLGEPYRVNVLAKDFTEMTAAQFSVGWSAATLRFDSVGALNPSLQLSANNFSFDATEDGQLPWLWFGEGNGTLADSTVIFSLHFTVTGEAGEAVEVGFGETPTEFYFSDTEGEVLSRFAPISKEILFPVSTDSAPAESAFRVFPNPAERYFRIATENNRRMPARMMLYDVRGRLLKQWNALRPDQRFATDALGSGVYLLELWTDNQRFTKRLVIKR